MFIWILWAALPNNLTSRCWWNLWVTASWSEVQVTTWTCNWHQSSWRESLKLPAYCCCSVAELCPTICDPMDCSTPGSPVLHYLPEFVQTHAHWVGDAASHFILCHPLLLPSVFLSIRVFSNSPGKGSFPKSPGKDPFPGSFVHIRWPKDWSFSFSISPSSGYSGLISFRTDWFNLFSVQGTLNLFIYNY